MQEENKVIHGYKSFSSDFRNQAGEIMIPRKHYHCNGEIKYNHNGFHMAVNFEDTIAFSDKKEDGSLLHDVVIAEVIGSGKIDSVSPSFSDYYGYYDLYACSDIEIIRYIPREELIEMALQLYDFKLYRFISNIYLTKEEIALFRGKDSRVDRVISYYHDKEVGKSKKYIY